MEGPCLRQGAFFLFPECWHIIWVNEIDPSRETSFHFFPRKAKDGLDVSPQNQIISDWIPVVKQLPASHSRGLITTDPLGDFLLRFLLFSNVSVDLQDAMWHAIFIPAQYPSA